MRFLLVLSWMGLAMAGCSNGARIGCDEHSDCPQGHACVSGRCEQLCELDTECARGYACDKTLGICQQQDANNPGEPKIEAIFGDGSEACTDSPLDRCFTDHLVIQGTNLTGSTYALQSTTGGSNFTLALAGADDAFEVQVALPLDLEEGSYTLVVQNAAGQDQTGVTILQGEPGGMTGEEILDRINTDATGTFVVARMPAANDLISRINDGTMKIDADLLPPTGGTEYDGDDLVGMINDNGTTMNINANRLATGDALMSRINSGSTDLSASLLPSGNNMISQINQGDGSIKISSTVLPTSSGSGGPSTGEEVVALLNDGVGSTDITVSRLPVGTASNQVAVGNHVHSTSQITSGTFDISRLPVGTGANQVAAGDHTHPGIEPLHWFASYGGTVAITGSNWDDFLDYCGDLDGCSIAMGYKNVDIGYGTYSSIMWGETCRFHIDTILNPGQWTLANGCGVNHSGYGSYWADTDNNGSRQTVLSIAVQGTSVCYLSEGSNGGTDNESGFYFWAAGSTSTGYTASSVCHLLVQD